MDNNELRTLRILEEIENEHFPTQRALAKKMNVSLGFINAFIKRLANKEFFNITTISNTRARYILTPKGAAEKARLTCAYIQFSLHLYRDARNKLRKLFADFVNQKVQSVVFYGAGELAEISYISLKETPIKLMAVVDDKKRGRIIFGNIVKDPKHLGSLSFDKILIASMGSKEEILEKILRYKISRDKIVLLE